MNCIDMEWNQLEYSDYYYFELQNILIDIRIWSSVTQVLPKHAYCRVSVVFLLVFFFSRMNICTMNPPFTQTLPRAHILTRSYMNTCTPTHEHPHTPHTTYPFLFIFQQPHSSPHWANKLFDWSLRLKQNMLAFFTGALKE